MRIAQVAPLHESVPPRLYGGTERIVSYLTEELVAQGHDVTLFASADSKTSARLVPVVQNALRLGGVVDPLAHHIVLLEKVAAMKSEFDIVHFHVDYLHFPVSRAFNLPNVTTLHGRLDLPDLVPVFNEFRDMPVISISDHQRGPLPQARWAGTVYHGLPEDLYPFKAEGGSYLAFLGRISPEKRADRAIEIAKRTGIELRIAAKVDRADSDYFKQSIEPLLDHPLINFVGEINDADKAEFLGNARALLFPIDWPEPFGLVMIESLACGTPVVAYPHGSVPEVLRDGETGYLVNGIDAAVEAVQKIDSLSRIRCRRVFEECFSARRMAEDYVEVYEKLIATRVPPTMVA